MIPTAGSTPRVWRMSRATQDRVGVLAVDDQATFLDAAQDVVTATPGFRWVGGATSGEEAIDAVGQLQPELVLLDVRMPGMDGIETAHRICGTHPDIVVVLISVDESPAPRPAIEASGAVGLVRKGELGPAMLHRLWSTYRKT
jgi:DNA-binding NarL/FixJ family response regulator